MRHLGDASSLPGGGADGAVNPPLPDQGSYDGEHGEGIDEPEEQPGVGA